MRHSGFSVFSPVSPGCPHCGIYLSQQKPIAGVVFELRRDTVRCYSKKKGSI